MGDRAAFTVRFWGVRGSIACSGPRTARYGGNTSSLEVRCGEQLNAGNGVTVRTAALNHPDGSTGYRVEYDGRSFCYVTDTEHVPGSMDRNVLGLISRADLVVYDCMYTDDEYRRYVGWGHST